MYIIIPTIKLSMIMLLTCVQVVCYWGTWANYRPEAGKFTPEDVDPSLCTHLIYSFAGLEQANWTMKSLDPWMDLEVGGSTARLPSCR